MSIYIGSLFMTNVSEVYDDKQLEERDCGIIQQVLADKKLIRLPWTSYGLTYTIINGAYDGAIGIKIMPTGVDRIIGGGMTALDGMSLINPKDKAKKGDFVTLIGDGNKGWVISQIVGNWIRE